VVALALNQNPRYPTPAKPSRTDPFGPVWYSGVRDATQERVPGAPIRGKWDERYKPPFRAEMRKLAGCAGRGGTGAGVSLDARAIGGNSPHSRRPAGAKIQNPRRVPVLGAPGSLETQPVLRRVHVPSLHGCGADTRAWSPVTITRMRAKPCALWLEWERWRCF
jgi:hypothetical protein